MFERDKEVLRRLGVPLTRTPLDVWEVDFGYSVDPEEYAIADPGLTEEERVALSLAARMVRVGGSFVGLDALRKLGGVERVGGVEPLGADLGPGAEVLGDLFSAVTQRRKAHFNYRGVKRTLNPYGIAHKRGHWYVAGASPEGERLYRVDRIESLEIGDETGVFEKPRRFDVRRIMDTQPWETGPDPLLEATVRFHPEVSWWAARTLGLPEPKGGLEATVPVANRDAFIGWVLSFGDGVEIVGPQELRAELRDRVESAMKSLS
jgi:predicted DNA-binding transcriptional regulator YafY